MVVYWQLFIAFFIPGIIGYGGGPASIPLIENEVVKRYEWLTVEEFGELLALGNALPGPIATKMAGYIGYEVGGIAGSIIALVATIAPSLLAMICLMGILYKFKDSPRIKRMTAFIRPVIAVLLGVLAYRFFTSSWNAAGAIHTVFLVIISILLLEKLKVHPAYLVLGSLVYGAINLS
jgi:chromate transporter